MFGCILISCALWLCALLQCCDVLQFPHIEFINILNTFRSELSRFQVRRTVFQSLFGKNGARMKWKKSNAEMGVSCICSHSILSSTLYCTLYGPPCNVMKGECVCVCRLPIAGSNLNRMQILAMNSSLNRFECINVLVGLN